MRPRRFRLRPSPLLLAGLALCASGPLWSQADQIWRCGNEYTNTRPAPARGCVPITQAAVTVIEGTRVQASSGDTAISKTDERPRVEARQQRQRDQDAQAVLQTELERARQQQQRLQRERPPSEAGRNDPAASERLQQWRDAVQRNEADIAGLQREIARLTGGKP